MDAEGVQAAPLAPDVERPAVPASVAVGPVAAAPVAAFGNASLGRMAAAASGGSLGAGSLSLVDAEHGVLLATAALSGGERFQAVEAQELAFDEDLGDDLFTIPA